MPAPIRLDGYRGDTFRQDLRLRSIVNGVLGDPLDLTGYTFAAQVRSSADGALLGTMTCTVNPNQTHVDTKGFLVLYMAPATTAAIPPGEWVWDLQMTEPDGDVFTRAKGPFIQDSDVTR